jgi:hypothetical protein
MSPARPERVCLLVLLLALGGGLAGCGGPDVSFHYPAERIDFSGHPVAPPSIFLGEVRDLRPGAQREGQGFFVGITYPADRDWDRPVTQIYRQALLQDLTQTSLVEVVPLVGQADYTLEADILSLHCRLQRSPITFLMPVAAGMGVGMAVGEDSGDRVKKGAIIGLAAMMALPLPTEHRAEAEVRLTLRDPQGQVVWTRSCLGEVDERPFVGAFDRSDQKRVDRYLVKAVKRCNACLLGQLRQELMTVGS